jgi:hypothetical protein
MASIIGAMARARVLRKAAVGVVNHGSRAVLVTLAPDGEFLDRRSVELVEKDLPTQPYHHEGQWAMGRYLNSSWARSITLPEALALVEKVRASVARCARERLETLAAEVSLPIASISIRTCAAIPETAEARIADVRAATMADSVMYREILADAAKERGWTVHWYDNERVLKDAGKIVQEMGRALGPPWQADHKLAAAAALAAQRLST